MKVLEAQNAILTNYEVYSHLADQRERYVQSKRKGPPNFETVVREVRLSPSPRTYMLPPTRQRGVDPPKGETEHDTTNRLIKTYTERKSPSRNPNRPQALQYFRTRPSPLSHDPITYTPECIAQLLERLRPYDLTKAEVIMLFNHRPETIATLNTVVEDLEERFSTEDQEALIGIVVEVLGQTPAAEEAAEDVAMEDGA